MSSVPLNITSQYLWIGCSVFLLLAVLGKYAYRLTLHPLARFPGPRLAAATTLYGGFYDLRNSSSYIKLWSALHDKYGPVVRVFPNTLHFQDMNDFNQIFKPGAKLDKHSPFYSIPVLEGGMFNDSKRKTALPRRAMYSPSFSRDAVRRAEPRIIRGFSLLMDKLAQYEKDGEPVDITRGFQCLTNDIAMDYVYQLSMGALEAEGFDSEYIKPAVDMVAMLHWTVYFPNVCGAIFKFTEMLPKWVVDRWLPMISTQKGQLQLSHDQITNLKSGTPGIDRPPSIFDTILNPNKEKGQPILPIKRIIPDGFSFIQAGTDTTATALTTGVFHLLDGSPHMLERLKGELVTALPHKHSTAEWFALEKLPYLHAVVKESLRLSYGVPGLIPRVVPEGGLVLAGQLIPGGTVVTSCILQHNMNASVYPAPDEFRPERWLDGDPKLDQYMVSFSRGQRNCIGMNLAYCEMYLTLAHLFRRFDLRLYETGKADMEWKDLIVPKRKNHLRVLLKEVEG